MQKRGAAFAAPKFSYDWRDRMLEQYPDLLTVQEMQTALAIGRSKAYGLLKNKEIISLKIGRSVRVPKASILEYIGRMCYTERATDGCS